MPKLVDEFFQNDFRNDCSFDDSNVSRTEYLRFCFSSLIQDELSKIKKE